MRSLFMLFILLGFSSLFAAPQPTSQPSAQNKSSQGRVIPDPVDEEEEDEETDDDVIIMEEDVNREEG